MPPHHADIGLLSVAAGRGTRSLLSKPNLHRTPTPPAQRPLTHPLISTHNPPPNEQTKERATTPRGYRPSLYERLKIFGVFRGSPPKRVFRAGPKWLWLLSPQKVMPVRRGQAHRQLHFENRSVIHPSKHQINTNQTPNSLPLKLVTLVTAKPLDVRSLRSLVSPRMGPVQTKRRNEPHPGERGYLPPAAKGILRKSLWTPNLFNCVPLGAVSSYKNTESHPSHDPPP